MMNVPALFLVAATLVGGCVTKQPVTKQAPESSVEQASAKGEVAQQQAREQEALQEQPVEKEATAQETDEERIAREKEDAWTKLMQRLRMSRDEIEGIDWYHYLRTPMTGEEKNIHAYIGKKNDLVWLRFRMVYRGSDWLFVESVAFKVDEETYELHYGQFDDWNRDHGGGIVWEWKDILVNSEIWTLINKIANSQRTVMRYRGNQYYSDRVVDEAEKFALKTVLSAYETMGGTQPIAGGLR